MSIYYVAGIPYSNELCHHGIKGQKWGVRRFQNDDGTYTAEGKERYGNSLGKYGSKNGVLRRLAIGDHALGIKRFADKREAKLLKKAEKREESGKDSTKIRKKYEAQKQQNIDRDKYISNQSTAKLVVKSMLMTPIGNHAYTSARARGESRFKSAILPSTLSSPIYVAVNAVRTKKKYGAASWSQI